MVETCRLERPRKIVMWWYMRLSRGFQYEHYSYLSMGSGSRQVGFDVDLSAVISGRGRDIFLCLCRAGNSHLMLRKIPFLPTQPLYRDPWMQ